MYSVSLTSEWGKGIINMLRSTAIPAAFLDPVANPSQAAPDLPSLTIKLRFVDGSTLSFKIRPTTTMGKVKEVYADKRGACVKGLVMNPHAVHVGDLLPSIICYLQPSDVCGIAK